MMIASDVGSVFAHGLRRRTAAARGCSSSRSSLVLGIFYFIILLPMKRKQQKVQEFLDSLKVGDRIITTGGIYGQITRLGDQSVQLQIADKVRIEVAKAAIGGYQGQAPVVDSRPESESRSAMTESSLESHHHSRRLRHLRRPSASIRSSPRATASPRPAWLMDKQLKLGLDLKGGVHLVLRVQTDDALRLETEAGDGAAARGAARRRNITVTNIDARRARRSSASKACRRSRTRRSAQVGERSPGELRPRAPAPTAPTRSR